MEEHRFCFLCNNPADFEVSKGEGGNRFTISCSQSCPTYEISKWAIKKLKDKPGRKIKIIQKIKSFTAEDLNDLPVIKMDNDSFEMIVTTKKRETARKE